MKIAIIQSNYLPWKGYFDIVNEVDKFVFLDDVQYTNRDWRNRNKIRTPGGLKWITVPVLGGIDKKIYEVRIDDSQDWREKHKRMIHHSYARSDFYSTYRDEIFSLISIKTDTLSELNQEIIKKISGILGISTEFINADDLGSTGRKDDKLIQICRMLDADEYISGPSAKDYIVEKKFADQGIRLRYFEYPQYPVYPQQWGGQFIHFVSIIDTLFNCGERSMYYIRGWRQ